MLRKIMIALLLVVFAPTVAVTQDKSLPARLLPLIKAHRGKAAVAVKHLDSGETFFHDADEEMPTASLIKFMIMLEVYMQVAEGKVKLSDMVTLHERDKVPGSGILTLPFQRGCQLSVTRRHPSDDRLLRQHRHQSRARQDRAACPPTSAWTPGASRGRA